MEGPPTAPEGLVQFLVTIAQSADVLNPHLSTPFLPEPSVDLELEMELSQSDEKDETDSLSFEEDITEVLP